MTIHRAEMRRLTKCLYVAPCSGRFGSYTDSRNFEAYLPPDASAEEIGKACREALSHSIYFTDDDELAEFSSQMRSTPSDEQWINYVVTKYGYKNANIAQKPLFTNLLRIENNTTTLLPTYQDSLDGFSGESIPDDHSQYVEAGICDIALGDAVLVALSRCKSKYLK